MSHSWQSHAVDDGYDDITNVTMDYVTHKFIFIPAKGSIGMDDKI